MNYVKRSQKIVNFLKDHQNKHTFCQQIVMENANMLNLQKTVKNYKKNFKFCQKMEKMQKKIQIPLNNPGKSTFHQRIT